MTKRVLVLVVAVACSKSNPKKQPDAAVMPDAARVCATVTPGMLDTLSFQPTGQTPAAIWGAPVTGSLGDGNTLSYQLEFYGGIEPSLSGTFDLTAGNQANYMSCAICLHAFDTNAQGMTVKEFFQSAGTITLSADPIATGHLTASLSNVELQEVTIDPNTFASTPVANGQCETYGNFMVDHDKAPNAWTCTHSAYLDGTTCDCMCGGGMGLYDPDCDLTNPPVNGCTTGQGCFKDGCVNRPLNQTCQTATPLVVGAAATTGTTIGAAQTYNAGLEGMGCLAEPSGVTVPGPNVVYSIAMTAATQYTVTLSSPNTTYDAAIALVGPDAGTPGSVCDAKPIATCIKGADVNGAGMGETFQVTPTATGTYFLVVGSSIPVQSDAFFGVDNAGTFSIAVTSP